MIQKQQFTLTATLLAVFLSPQIYAIEDCGTSVTECKMWQTINTQQKLIQTLTEQLKKVTKLTDKIHVSSDGKLGIGTTTPKAKLEVTGNLIRTIAYATGNDPIDGRDVGQIPSRVLSFNKAKTDT